MMLLLFCQNIPAVEEQDWEPLLYAPVADYSTVASLQSYSRTSVIGTVHSVKSIPLFHFTFIT